MTHLISPTSFRLAKTFLWKQNVVDLTNLSINRVGVQNLLKYSFRRKRLFVIKSTLKIVTKLAYSSLFVLFMPRIKTRPRPDSRGNFSKFVLYKQLNWKRKRLVRSSKKYIDERRLKIHKFAKVKKPQINK